MDVFSLGCVLAELFTDGTPLFDLASLLAFRDGRYSPQTALNRIADAEIRTLITAMVQRSPDARPSAAQLLAQGRDGAFPLVFETVLHPFFLPFAEHALPQSPDQKVMDIKLRWGSLEQELAQAPLATRRDAYLLVSGLLLSCVRHLTITSAKLAAIELILNLAERVRLRKG